MGKLVRQCDMEVMKMAMLKHEETFRQQVHELHRLYRIQTQMMSDLSTRRQQRRRTKQPRRALDLQLPADEYIGGGGADENGDDDDGTGLELTLAVGGRTAGARKNGKNRRGGANSHAGNGGGGFSPFASDCSGGTSLTSSPSSAEYSEGAAAVLHGYAYAPPQPPPCQRAMAFDLGVGEAMKHQSPWQLVQCPYPLSLRMT